ncbi:Bro1 [Heliothis virescens ascovirus 3e]|uniref:Bro1 n=2 Tax=Ascovirus hvav3a TaxID=3444724 RepID=A4KX69_HVAVE|nr:Bro1 [Heliothis virescens ascovirus 3e]YP_009701669.1 Bro1 [Heliothis virescens ascovirus 3g]ABO37199.1 Bro1 [Heliothis virescens ascovirus 3e]AFV50265.1 Bro1 [Heliothis virescens ascovirus 3g]
MGAVVSKRLDSSETKGYSERGTALKVLCRNVRHYVEVSRMNYYCGADIGFTARCLHIRHSHDGVDVKSTTCPSRGYLRLILLRDLTVFDDKLETPNGQRDLLNRVEILSDWYTSWSKTKNLINLHITTKRSVRFDTIVTKLNRDLCDNDILLSEKALLFVYSNSSDRRIKSYIYENATVHMSIKVLFETQFSCSRYMYLATSRCYQKRDLYRIGITKDPDMLIEKLNCGRAHDLLFLIRVVGVRKTDVVRSVLRQLVKPQSLLRVRSNFFVISKVDFLLLENFFCAASSAL